MMKRWVAGLVLATALLGGCDAFPSSGPVDREAKAGIPTDRHLGSANLDPVLANPKVGDLYAAELTAFSGEDFYAGVTRPSPGQKTYGLMKVIEVKADKVTAITETNAWGRPQGARNDLNGDLKDIRWDNEEKIPIKRADFARLVAEEKILEVRRL